MIRTAFTALASLLLLLCGLVHGFWTERWYSASEPTAAAARFESIPMEIGDWQGQTIERRASSGEAAFVGNIQRRYTNRHTGESVVIALICGRPGPVSIHTPNACYSASGYRTGPASKAKIPGTTADFWNLEAVRTRAAEETRLRIFWAWNPGQGWIAADDSRMQFARYPVLHKLYVQREVINAGEPSREDPCITFIQQLIPVLDRTLFQPGS